MNGAPGGRKKAFVGVGLRPVHFPHLLGRPRVAVEWFETISENSMDSEGRPLEAVLRMREDYPIALHGVSMSIGGVEGPRPGYLEKLKTLADRVQPFLVTDHLCFTGAHASNVHDLLPLPYTEEAIETVARNVRKAQDVLKRRIALENVSSYLTYKESTMTEWEFLVEVARRADCRILLDVNNVYVSAVNHGFAPEAYVDAVPAELVAQIHLGGYTDTGKFLFDTHSRAPTDPVWELYRRVIGRMPETPVLIEWDEDVPEWSGLEAQAVKAAQIAAEERGRQPA
jgi:uncharacterized protein (UPF0276 family)